MAPSTFHLFPILPPELRLAIWELAIRPTNEKHGLHHFTIIKQEDNNQEDFGLQHPHSAWRPQYTAIVPTNNNKSVYLWDAGLWTACVDSRDVMMKHFRIRQWEMSRRERELMPAISLLKDKLSKGEHFDYSAKTTARRGHEGWELIVQPVMDMFCFKSKDW